MWRIFLLFLIIFYAGQAVAADLRVKVVDLRSDKGDVHIAVYNMAEGFPDHDGMLAEVTVGITKDYAQAVFPGLSAGRYGVAVYHDEDGDHDFDQGFLGWPLEGFAFSNGAEATLFGAPSFSQTAMPLEEIGSQFVIPMGYW
jgi:uncharacterized protein (DUF2141 family)